MTQSPWATRTAREPAGSRRSPRPVSGAGAYGEKEPGPRSSCRPRPRPPPGLCTPVRCWPHTAHCRASSSSTGARSFLYKQSERMDKTNIRLNILQYARVQQTAARFTVRYLFTLFVMFLCHSLCFWCCSSVVLLTFYFLK